MDLLIATSPIREFSYIDMVIDSIRHQTFRKRYILFDYPNNESIADEYNKYIKRVRDKYEKDGFILLVSEKHRHFREGVKWAINTFVKSDWICLIQHDVTIPQSINLQKLYTEKPEDAHLIYIPPPSRCRESQLLPWKPRNKTWWKKTEVISDDWVKTWGWSERVFIFNRSWMVKMLQEEYNTGRRRFFIEEVVAVEIKKKDFKPDEVWKDWKTYAYRQGIHRHLVGHSL